MRFAPRLARATALAALVLTAAAARATDCTDYRTYAHLQGRLHLAEPITALASGADHAYAATAAGEVVIIATGDPAAMQVAATVAVGAPATSIAHLVRRGDVLFAATSGTGGGVVALDISQPTAPQHLATLPIVGGARLLAPHGDLLLVQRAQADTLDVVWAASPASMDRWSSVGMETRALLSGHQEGGGPDSQLFYVRTRTDLDVWDLADPAQPTLRGRLDRGDATPARSLALTADRTRLLLPGAWADHVEVVDVSLPHAPVEVGQIPLRYTPEAIDVVDDLAYITLVSGAVDIFDVADLAAPLHLGSLPGPAGVATALAGEALYGASGPVLSAYTTVGADRPYPAVGHHDHGWGFTYDALRRGDHVYVSGDIGLQVLDVGDPTSPVQTFGAHPPAGAALHGEHLFVGDTGGLTVYGLSDPAVPTLLAVLDLPDWRGGPELEAAGGVLVVGLRDSLVTFDVTDPLAPQRLGSRVMAVQTLEIAAGRVFVLGPEALSILDLAAPATLPLLGHVDLDPDGEDLATDGVHAWVCNVDVRQGVIDVIDVQDPAAPQLVHTVEEIYARGVALHGDRLLCSQGGWGVQLLDVGTPTAPRYAGHLYHGYQVGWAYRARVLGDLTWVGHDAGSAFLPAPCVGAVVGVPDDGAAAPGDQPPDPARIARTLPVRAHPNPFNPRVTVRFTLPAASGTAGVDVAVFDARGRLVRHLMRGRPLAGGTHELVWDGSDHAGRPVASGAYLARVRAGGRQGAVRLVLVR